MIGPSQLREDVGPAGPNHLVRQGLPASFSSFSAFTLLPFYAFPLFLFSAFPKRDCSVPLNKEVAGRVRGRVYAPCGRSGGCAPVRKRFLSSVSLSQLSQF